ncbi:hypothetical protein B0H12DRAFT_1076848 [Mycena haematopus]|nr:hypothetical protein B0H12DRAFT_1076848 [Mycena haematopus]
MFLVNYLLRSARPSDLEANIEDNRLIHEERQQRSESPEPEIPGPTECLCREWWDAIRTHLILRRVNTNITMLTDREAISLRPKVLEILLAFAGPSAENILLVEWLETSFSLVGPGDLDHAICLRVFAYSDEIQVREQNIALAVIAARAEQEHRRRHPPASTEGWRIRCCRAAAAYAGLCQMIAAVGRKTGPTMITVCFLDAGAGLMTFGSTLAEKSTSDDKERLRKLRNREMEELFPHVEFRAGEVERWDGKSAYVNYRLEETGLISYHPCPNSVALYLRNLRRIDSDTGLPNWMVALNAKDASEFHMIVRRVQGYAQACGNCVQLVEQLFEFREAVMDLGAELLTPSENPSEGDRARTRENEKSREKERDRGEIEKLINPMRTLLEQFIEKCLLRCETLHEDTGILLDLHALRQLSQHEDSRFS